MQILAAGFFAPFFGFMVSVVRVQASVVLYGVILLRCFLPDMAIRNGRRSTVTHAVSEPAP